MRRLLMDYVSAATHSDGDYRSVGPSEIVGELVFLLSVPVRSSANWKWRHDCSAVASSPSPPPPRWTASTARR